MMKLVSVRRCRRWKVLVAALLIVASPIAWSGAAAAQSNTPAEVTPAGNQLGVSLTDRAAHIDHGYGALRGVLITAVAPAGSAERAGLKAHDIVLTFDGMHVHDARQLWSRLARLRAGQSAELDIEGNGERQTIIVTIGSRT
jgi:S1-C subfamily serine protease